MIIEEWAKAQLEPGREVKTIQLAAEGVIWETWGAPFAQLDEFVAGAKAIIAANAAQTRKGRVGLLYTALGGDGQIRSQFAAHCMGTNAEADTLVGGGGGSARAFSDAMLAQASLMNTLLKSAQLFVEQVTKANESLTAQIVDLQEYKHAMQQIELTAKAEDGKVPDFILTQLKDLAPHAMTALNLFLESQAKSPAASVVKTGIAAVHNLNGAPKS